MGSMTTRTDKKERKPRRPNRITICPHCYQPIAGSWWLRHLKAKCAVGRRKNGAHDGFTWNL